MQNTVTQQDIDALISASNIQVATIHEKVTVMHVKLPSGFVLTETSGAVDKANYSEETGARVCLEKIKSKLWYLEGYRLQCAVAKQS